MPKRRTPKPKINLGKNGRVLTAKHVPERDYQTIHGVLYGSRQAVLHGLLKACTEFAKGYGSGWEEALTEGRVSLALNAKGKAIGW